MCVCVCACVVAAEVSEKVRHDCDSGTKSEGEEDSQAASIAGSAKGKSPLGKFATLNLALLHTYGILGTNSVQSLFVTYFTPTNPPLLFGKGINN